MTTIKDKVSFATKMWVRSLNSAQSVFLLIIRLYWGYSFIMTGRGKFMNWDRTVEFFQSLNIPMPEINVGMAASTEFFGGICLLLGLGSRFITVPLIFTMGVAYATAHREELLGIFDDADPFVSAPPFLFLYTCIVILLFGAGKFSLDYLIAKNRGCHDLK